MAKALDTSSRALLHRLWRDHVAGHRRGILIALACTLGVAASTALYPVVIQQSFDRYTEGRHDWLWLVPIVIIAVTSLKAATHQLLKADIYPWYGTAALPEYLKSVDKVWKKKMAG